MLCPRRRALSALPRLGVGGEELGEGSHSKTAGAEFEGDGRIDP